jgi:hypothetical protein
MSDDWIILIPENPRFRPERARQMAAEVRFSEIAPQAHEVTSNLSDTVQFYHCGANFERIKCPSCGSDVPIDWWQDRMDEDFDDGFKLRPYRVPCCNGEMTLHELAYEWPQGFGQYSLEAMNPNIGQLSNEHKQDFEGIVGTPLRVIYLHL